MSSLSSHCSLPYSASICCVMSSSVVVVHPHSFFPIQDDFDVFLEVSVRPRFDVSPHSSQEAKLT